MVASLLFDGPKTRALADSLRPAPLAGGGEPEERVIFCGMGWRGYLAADEDGSGYSASPRSRLLPDLDPALIVRCLKLPKWLEARRVFCAEFAAD
jgi:hypothetical protein